MKHIFVYLRTRAAIQVHFWYSSTTYLSHSFKTTQILASDFFWTPSLSLTCHSCVYCIDQKVKEDVYFTFLLKKIRVHLQKMMGYTDYVILPQFVSTTCRIHNWVWRTNNNPTTCASNFSVQIVWQLDQQRNMSPYNSNKSGSDKLGLTNHEMYRPHQIGYENVKGSAWRCFQVGRPIRFLIGRRYYLFIQIFRTNAFRPFGMRVLPLLPW
jgi:hypothetical protein